MMSAHSELSGILHSVGVTSTINILLRAALEPELTVETMTSEEQLYHRFLERDQPADTVLLGMGVEEAVAIAQRIHSYDHHVPILILAAPAHFERLKRTLMARPFLGSEVKAWSIVEIDELPSAIRDAVNRRQQRLQCLPTISYVHLSSENPPPLQSEAAYYLDQLFDHAPIGIVTIDLDCTMLAINRQARNIFQIREWSGLGDSLSELFPVREKERVNDFLKRGWERAERYTSEIFEVDIPDGNILFLEITPAPPDYRTNRHDSMLILQDVTDRIKAEYERQRAEEELRYHATVLRSFHEISSDRGLHLEEKLHRLLELGCRQFGLSNGMLARIDGQIFQILDSVTDHPAYVVGTCKELDQTYCSATVFTNEAVAFEHAGVTEWRNHPSYLKHGMEAYIGVRVIVGGGLYGTLCFSSPVPRHSPFNSADMEVIKLMSQWVGNELQRERAEAHMFKLSSALEQTADLVMIADSDRRIEYVNPAFERLTGYSAQELIGDDSYLWRSDVNGAEFYQDLWQVIGNGGVYRGIMLNRKKDGSVFHEQKTISPLKDMQGRITHFISTGHDITDQVKAQELDRQRKEELAHVGRLSILGEMISGLAHELNQPLCAITTYAQTCLRVIQSGSCKCEDVRYGLEQVVKQAELSGAIFQRLRKFARKDDLRQQSIDLREVILEVANFVRADVQQNQVQLHMEISPSLPVVVADPIQIEQVLLNLVRNSIDALGDVDEAQRQITIKATPHEGGSVKVCINDSGCGCSQEVLDRLFEPFFTTKETGLGIGLGISQSIIEAYGGRLWLEPNTTHGAKFCFILPGFEEA
ncbi:GAF domain-containing sensor histidine kinase [Thiobacillus sp.]